MKRYVFILFCVLFLFSGCGESSYERKMSEKEREEEVAETAYKEGYDDGYSDGSDDGYYDGYMDGFNDASANSEKRQSTQTYSGAGLVWKETPGSSCFSYVGYDSEYQKLAVIFRDNPEHTFVYSDFTMSDYRDFIGAESLGSYYNKKIKGNYPSERIDDPSGTNFVPW